MESNIIQCQVLNKILQTKDFSIVTLNNLTEDYFSVYKAEFNYIKNHYNIYKTIPDKLTFMGNFQEFDWVEVTEPNTYLIEKLFKVHNDEQMAIGFNDVKRLIEAGKSEDAKVVISNLASKLVQGTALQSVDLLQDTSRFDRYVEKMNNPNKAYISTGFAELDALIGGIDVENENMVIAARTGIGKSWTLLIMAVAALKQGLNVGIYSGEMTEDKVGYRIDTLLGHINNRDIMRGNAYSHTAYKNYIQSIKTMELGSLKVLTPSNIAGPATVEVLQAFMEKDKLDILFVDQYSLLEDTSHAKAQYDKVANISRAIKNLQVLKRKPIISVTQMNRTKNDDGSQDTTQIGLSDRIGQDATTVIMLDKKAEPLNSGETEYKLTLNVVKARDGGDNKKLNYRADFNKGTFDFIPEDMSDAEAQAEIDSYEVDSSEVPF